LRGNGPPARPLSRLLNRLTGSRPPPRETPFARPCFEVRAKDAVARSHKDNRRRALEGFAAVRRIFWGWIQSLHAEARPQGAPAVTGPSAGRPRVLRSGGVGLTTARRAWTLGEHPRTVLAGGGVGVAPSGSRVLKQVHQNLVGGVGEAGASTRRALHGVGPCDWTVWAPAASPVWAPPAAMAVAPCART